MSLIERWNIEGNWNGDVLTLVSGGRIAPGEQVGVVRESDYEALSEQLRGAVDALREIAEQELPTGNASAATAFERMRLVARNALAAVGGQYEAATPPAADVLRRLVEHVDQRCDRSRLDEPLQALVAEARDLVGEGR